MRHSHEFCGASRQTFGDTVGPSKVLTLTAATIHSFRSILGEVRVPIEPGIQFLVGRNGSGKSTILQAIGLLSSSANVPPNRFPKALTQTERRALPNDTVFVSAEFQVRRTDNGHNLSLPEDVTGIIRRVFADGNRTATTNLGESPEIDDSHSNVVQESIAGINSYLDSFNFESSHSEGLADLVQTAIGLTRDEASATLFRPLTDLANMPAADGFNVESEELNQLVHVLRGSFSQFDRRPQWANDIDSYFPAVTFVPSRYDLPDEFALAQAENAADGSMLSAKKLLQLAGLSPASLRGLEERERQQVVHQGNEILQDVIQEHWTQEKLTIQLTVNPDDRVFVSLRESTGAYVAPSESSEGLKWFLPFFINMMVDLGSEWKNAIILVDDSGVFLHLEAQKEVRDLLIALADSNAVVVATHSPTLLSLADSRRIYVVEKQETSASHRGGTTVTEARSSGKDERVVIRTAMGMTIGDTLFGNQTTLIVEGPSDRWYVEGAVRLRAFRDVSDRPGDAIGVLSAEDADNIEKYAVWCDTKRREFAVILDSDSKGRGRKKRLEEIGLGDHVVLITDYLRPDIAGDGTIEDVFGAVAFDESLSSSHATNSMPAKSIAAAATEQPTDKMNPTRGNGTLARLRGKKTKVNKNDLAIELFNRITRDPSHERSLNRLVELALASVNKASTAR
jgi:ABC-type lipoprotein export system ATPase subunit